MFTGLCVVIFGILIIFHPELLAIMFALLLILFGMGMMAASWQFRRLRKHSQSRFINWIVRW